MGNVIDLTAEPEHEILHRTEADGLFGGRYLSGQPLAAYLESNEEPKYALRNKKSGVQIESRENRTLEPGRSYQMLAVVTDLRIVFVAGQSDGDVSMILPLSDIVQTHVETGIRTATLTVETLADERWSFTCRGDLSPVRTYLEDAAQIWANAARLLDDLEESLGIAQDRLTEREYDQTREALDGAEATIQTAERRIADVGAAARTQLGERSETLREWLVDLRRELFAAEGAQAHASAQRHWQKTRYEDAATAYERALDVYERALEIDGSVPTDEALRSRYRAAAGEREILRVGPVVDADASRRRAMALADPEEAAAEWEIALDRYRELLGLDWGSTDREFAVDRERLREQTTEIADDAIDDYCEAGRRWLHAGDKLAIQGRKRQAEQVYDRAHHQFEQADQLVREVRPERTEQVETALAAADRRLAGETPTETVPDDPIAFDPLAATTEENDDATTDSEGIERLTFHDSGAEMDPRRGNGSTVQTDTQRRQRRRKDTPVLERIRAQKQTTGGELFETSHGMTSESVENADEKVATGARRTGERADRIAALLSEELTDEQLRTRVEELSAESFRELVTALWEAEGWMTTAIGDAGETVYDMVSTRGESDQKQLIWIRHHEDDRVGDTTIKRCATIRETSGGSADAVFVTTDSLTTAAKRRADDLDVTVVDHPTLIDRLEAVEPTDTHDGYGESPQA